MNKVEIEKMADLESEYWWHVGKKTLVNELIRHHFQKPEKLNILEIGCGTGGLTETLQQFGEVTGFDISESAVEYCRQKGLANIFVKDITKIEPRDYFERYDLILALDVLEHIQEDVQVMKKVKEMLKPDGLFFINVPAHKFLWSEHDEALEHKRRYHRLELMRKVNDSGFEPVSNSYFVLLSSPGIILYRFWGNLFGKTAYPKTSYVLLPKFINNFFIWLLKIETKMLLNMRIPFGVTLNVVARKKKN